MAVTAEQVVRQEIERQGRVTFARFMELALYAPGVGYYSARPTGGEGGDYVTAPGAHPAFGALLALQLEQMWDLLGRPLRFTVVEPGAGSGVQARDILRYAQAHLPRFAESLRYLALDLRRPPPSGESPGPQWLVAAGLPLRHLVGCILANELLDAFPVHRFVVQQGQVREVYVTLRAGHLVEEVGPPSTPALFERVGRLGAALPDGFQGEINLALLEWLQDVAAALHHGFALIIDYGGRAEELYTPERRGGTLRSYYRHTLSGNPYHRVGLQDLTAHVDFSVVVEVAQRVGLIPLGYTTQRQFLRNLGLDAFLKALTRRSLPSGERYASQMGMRELARPGGMGEFKVLALGQGVGKPRLHGFSHGNALIQRLHAQVDTLEVPQPTDDHARLLEAKYPHLASRFQDQWVRDDESQEKGR